MDWRIGHGGFSLPRAVGSVISLSFAGLIFSGCGTSAPSNALQACKFVQSGVSLYGAATNETDPVKSHREMEASLKQLRAALPDAAIAAGSNGGYQALEATLSETNRVPEKLLISALVRQCSVIMPTNTELRVPGGSIPPTNSSANAPL